MNEIKFMLISLYRSVSIGGCLDFRGGTSHKLFMLLLLLLILEKLRKILCLICVIS